MKAQPAPAPASLPSSKPASDAAALSRCFRSSDLFEGTREVLIEHDGSYYRLRLTQANKLILTK